ncbi:hypothetical protein Pth03_23730 [Planotetraspora thailandica]|uniref:Flagellar biosynthetic protein FliP n=1 Tax=Planotetraspora thailandica TaxID=487172 RepID=A0A8J3V4Q9_9ACTN|nr:hypothetical protein [Planotetraspora thailandica]GII53984.1 hypothetical protein Pth03_23730 [Planotetraspora thailandica]
MTQTATKARRGWRRFTLHYIEMILAMFAGMFALGFLRSAVGLHVSHTQYPELGYLVMAFDMSVGMAAWMRVRGHAWRHTLEMCAAMFAPAVPLFPLLWLGVVDGDALMVLAHLAMFPLMLGVMLLRPSEHT